MIGLALACEPKLLIADEPTTALDVTIQAQILGLLDDLKQRLQMGLLLITHDLGVIAGRTDRVVVMYAGRVVETAETPELFAHRRHPYTAALMESIPRIRGDQRSTPLLDPRHATRPDQPAAPLPVCRALSVRAGPLPAAGARARRRRRQPSARLLFPGCRRDATTHAVEVNGADAS